MRTRWWLLLIAFCSAASAAVTFALGFGYVIVGFYDEPRADRSVEEAEQRRVAAHEAGHAIVTAWLLGPAEVERISVFATLPPENHYGVCHTADHNRLETADDILRSAAVSMAGRAADAIVNNGPTTGAGADLGHVNDVVWNMHLVSGLGGSLLVRSRGEAPASMVMQVEQDIDSANHCAEAIVRANRDIVVLLADRIMRVNVSQGARVLSGDGFRAFLVEHPLSSPPETVLPTLMIGCVRHVP